MAKNKGEANYVEDLPMILLDDRISVDAKVPLIAPFASQLGLSMEEALYFIQGIIRYHDDMEAEHSGYFKFKLEDVEIIEKTYEYNGKEYTLGEKARLHFKAKAWKSNKIEDQYIDTGWITFSGFNPEVHVFDMSVANKLKEIAEENIGKWVVARKHNVDDGEGSSYRYLGHLRPGKSDEDDDEDDDDSRSSRRSSSRRSSGGRGKSSGRRGKSWDTMIEEAVESIDSDGVLNEEDVQFLSEDLSKDSEADDIKDAIIEYLGIKARDLPKIKEDDFDNTAEYSVALLSESLAE